MTCIAQWLALSSSSAATQTNEVRVAELQGTAEVSPAGATTWISIQTNQVLYPNDRLRVGAKSRVGLRWTDQSFVSLRASSEVEILPPPSTDPQSSLRLVRGIMSFFHRDKPGLIRVITRGASAGVEGTEFVLAAETINNTEQTTLFVVDGRVQLSNDRGSVLVTNGESAVAESGKAPVRTAGFVVNNILQWSFYYPAVLDLADLPMKRDEQTALGQSMDAYRAGDLLAALAKYPTAREPASRAEQIYHAALVLSVGQVESAEAELGSAWQTTSDRTERLAAALRKLIAAVKQQDDTSTTSPQFATEMLAGSYYEQSRANSRSNLNAALALARQAVTNSPEFGFGWTRVAELEFGFGHTRAAMEALDKGLAFSPRNAQALTLKGFLLAAQNRPREAVEWFDRALAVDPALGNAWLGRGLCRIRRGDTSGREDLLAAAALEPQRSELRSYLGKAYGNEGDYSRAVKELALAKTLDPNDPTAWLYSALLNQEHNRINEAISDLEKSQELNNNRVVYRSTLLLDQDQAVRSANLATMYQDAGMFDVSVREAGRAVNYDYGNYSAHLFLANSYLAMSDPQLFNLRYETPAQNEYLLANLLAPASAGALSPAISQQEYSRLLERDRFGVVSSTEYLSRGAWTQSGAQYGNFGNFNYSVAAFYRWDPGQRVNNDVEQRQLALTLKQQLSFQDSLYLQVQDYHGESGDLAQYYNQNFANSDVRVEETQRPIVSLGYHHEWNPGIHTLVFGARLDDTTSFNNPFQPVIVVTKFGLPPATPVYFGVNGTNVFTAVDYQNRLEIYSAEVQQIWQTPIHNTVVGGRFQYGNYLTDNLITPMTSVGGILSPTNLQQNADSLFRRVSLYGYHQWQVAEPLQLIGGIAYDKVWFPENLWSSPISGDQQTEDAVSPKAGLIWMIAEDTVFRFAYTRSLGGASFDQSYRIEPSQVAGFVQSFRSIIPESVAGPNAGAQFETFGASLEQKFDSGTYLAITGEILNSDVDRIHGAYDNYPFELDYAIPSKLREQLDFQERALTFTANQLIAHSWSLGARYRLTEAVLNDDFVDLPVTLDNPSFHPKQRLESVLHQLSLTTIYNNPKGFFAAGEAAWYMQSNEGFATDEPGDHFWQLNFIVGFRSPRRNVEISAGLLNLTDHDYQLEPLTAYNELPRERTVAVRLRLNF